MLKLKVKKIETYIKKNKVFKDEVKMLLHNYLTDGELNLSAATFLVDLELAEIDNSNKQQLEFPFSGAEMLKS
jgi:hypothetical protein